MQPTHTFKHRLPNATSSSSGIRRLIFVTHNVVSGDGQGMMNRALIREALARGIPTVAVADRIDEDLLEMGVEYRSVHPRPTRPALIKVLAFVQRADQIIRTIRRAGDIVIANGVTLSLEHHVNLISFVHSFQIQAARRRTRGLSVWRRNYHSLYHWCNARWEKQTLCRAQRIVVPSHRVRGELKAMGFALDRVDVVHYGIASDKYYVDGPVAKLPVNGQSRRLALYVGDLQTDRKNLSMILQSLKLVEEVELLVVGRLPGSPFPRIARSLGVAERVHFLGYRKDVPNIMRACDFMVFPTRYEPFGLVILEAVASGLPVITSKIAGASELLDPTTNILLDDLEDVSVLAAAMREVAGYEADTIARVRKTAYATVQGRDWSCVFDKYYDVFVKAYEAAHC